ncbi:MAG: hypothetical protein ACODAC_09150 [Pseudomonadota bacterium]
MSEVYRLVFRGEVLEGQHPAVVRKRLARLASFGEAQLDTLFSGKSVVLKRAADGAAAARYQAVFRKAGARLRVVPVAAGEDAPTAPGFELLPPGSDVLRADERPVVAAPEVDTSGLAVQETEPRPAPESGHAAVPAPDVAHLSLAEAGADLGVAAEPPPAVSAPEFAVAEVGEDLGPRRAREPPAPPDTSHLELAPEPGGN